MASYLQMGFAMEGLVGAPYLTGYHGLILSPVNRAPHELLGDISGFRSKGTFDIVFDPQLYVPTSDRGSLREHDYFPHDLETADPTRESWWKSLAKTLAKCARELSVDCVASPVALPKIWDDDFYLRSKQTASMLCDFLAGKDITVLQTLVVNYASISQEGAAERVASIISDNDAFGYYLVIYSDVHPRRELLDGKSLAGVMRLIRLLEQTGKRVLVGFCSSELLLYKAAGASHCASGKFFNLRRFSKDRFDEEKKGGKQMTYWFEHSLLSFLRAADVIRLQKEGLSKLLAQGPSDTHFAREILKQIAIDPEEPWLAEAWRHQLSAFEKIERRYSPDNLGEVDDALKIAEKNWERLNRDEDPVILDETFNDGRWIRPWRQALSDYKKAIKST